MATTKFSTIIGSSQVVPTTVQWVLLPGWSVANAAASSVITVYHDRFLNMMRASGTIKLNGANTGVLQLNLPSGMTLDTANFRPGDTGGTSFRKVGTASFDDTSASSTFGQYDIVTNGTSATQFIFQRASLGTSANESINATLPVVAAASDTIYFDITIPIAEWLLTGYTAQGAGLATSVKPGLVTTETSGTFNGNLSGNVSTGFAVCNWYKVGRMVTLEVDSITYTATAAAQLIVSLTNMPASARPRAASPTSRIVTQAVVSGTAQVAVAYAQPTILNFSSTITGSNWPASGSQTQQATVFSWLTD